jgi:exodeoxyribonuclease VII small subunit
MSANEQSCDFEAVKSRLAEIASAVEDDSLPLDEALDLYEEAVSLGLQASDMLETGIVVPDEDMQSDEDTSSNSVAIQEGDAK